MSSTHREPRGPSSKRNAYSAKRTALYLQSIDPTQNRYRWYLLDLQPDLFGGVNLVRRWGRIGRPGRTRLEHFADPGAATRALDRAVERRLRRGYRTA